MEYRNADFNDFDILAELRIEMLNEDTVLTETQKDLIRDNTKHFLSNGLKDGSVICRIAVENKLIIGMGCINFFSLPPNDWCPDGTTAYIGNIYVIPSLRQRGIAAAILSYLMEQSHIQRCQRILLHTTEKGRPLYTKFGFEASPTAMACYPELKS